MSELLNLDPFFETARERYKIKLHRENGDPYPWTQDDVYREWRFCNVHREDDKTTRWYRENVRHPLCQETSDDNVSWHIRMVNATIAFRWFCKIETGQIIQDLLVGEWDAAEARRRLEHVHPVVTGAYVIWSTLGMNKLDGVLDCIERCRQSLPRLLAPWEPGYTLQGAWTDLNTVMGPFMAYEVVSDLRWTPLLEQAPDILTWANAGPGCTRGINRVLNGRVDTLTQGSKTDQARMNEIMQELLAYSRDNNYWPSNWRAWEMREVEHWACEFDKYTRASRGDKMKRRFHPATR